MTEISSREGQILHNSVHTYLLKWMGVGWPKTPFSRFILLTSFILRVFWRLSVAYNLWWQYKEKFSVFLFFSFSELNLIFGTKHISLSLSLSLSLSRSLALSQSLLIILKDLQQKSHYIVTNGKRCISCCCNITFLFPFSMYRNIFWTHLKKWSWDLPCLSLSLSLSVGDCIRYSQRAAAYIISLHTQAGYIRGNPQTTQRIGISSILLNRLWMCVQCLPL